MNILHSLAYHRLLLDLNLQLTKLQNLSVYGLATQLDTRPNDLDSFVQTLERLAAVIFQHEGGGAFDQLFSQHLRQFVPHARLIQPNQTKKGGILFLFWFVFTFGVFV